MIRPTSPGIVSKRAAVVGAVVLVFPRFALADAGVPMLFLVMPGMGFALVPVIALEAWVLKNDLALPISRSSRASLLANLISTVAGIPLTWVGLVLLELAIGGGSAHGIATPWQKLYAVTAQAPWLIPYEEHLYWMIPSAALVLLLPFFAVSYYLEERVVRRIAAGVDPMIVKSGVFRANVLSYGALASLLAIWLVWSLVKGPTG